MFETLFGVALPDANHCTAVGMFGQIVHTTDGGATWTAGYYGGAPYLGGVCFTDTNTGTTVGAFGTILRTTNGGTTWVDRSQGTVNSFVGVYFTDFNNGTAVGSTLIRTTDGGVSWGEQSRITNNGLSSVFFEDSRRGTGVGQYGTILHTTDGGGTWVEEERGHSVEGPRVNGFKASPNPFTSFTRVPGRERDCFSLYDISGRRVGTYRGDRIGEGLEAGVYFVRALDSKDKPLRIVKIR
jgi:photosystem II stability/assembly factor-like uncharacterized protein